MMCRSFIVIAICFGACGVRYYTFVHVNSARLISGALSKRQHRIHPNLDLNNIELLRIVKHWKHCQGSHVERGSRPSEGGLRGPRITFQL